MTKFKIGDAVWVRAEFWGYRGERDRMTLKVGNGEVVAIKGDCRENTEPDIKQAIREVLLSEEFMKAFAAAWMKTPSLMAMHFDENYRDSIKSLTHRPFVEPATEATNDPT